jgi:DMSO/TMAO reductase YedYZ molybdopterin-dependent catalytic subunit
MLSVLGLVVLILFALFLSLKPMQVVNAEENVSMLPTTISTVVGAGSSQVVLNATISLTLVGANGSQSVLNATDIAWLPSYTGYGGFKNVLGNLKGLGNYTGVPLITLCNLVGGISDTDSVNITGSDGYFQIFTYDEVNGDFVTYDNTTGQQVSHSQPLVPIVAYYFNGANLSSDQGPLRLVIVGPEGLCTDSTYWVKWVVRITVVQENVPEFPSLLVFPLFLLATLVAGLSLRARRRYRILLCDSKVLTEGRDERRGVSSLR